ncbi:MAG: phosphoribosyl-ATP diphosphatase [Magnetococcales bacterium]|nr:phosphoribosyl-ATP diphosphatase [Magnetococcales bacterium]
MTAPANRALFLDSLYNLLVTRKHSADESSYVARLHRQGLEHILKKVGEEAVETLLAASRGNHQEIVHETADLWFHTLVMLAHLDIHPDVIMDELIRRHQTTDARRPEGPKVDPTGKQGTNHE